MIADGRPARRAAARTRAGHADSAVDSANEPRPAPTSGTTRQALASTRALLNHARISSDAPAPQRSGGAGATPFGELRLSLHGPRKTRRITTVSLQGKGLWRDHGKVKVLDKHHVEIKLGASYPRTMPELRWITPIYHPNISEIGMVCLGGYGTHWVPSVQLDEFCNMLWDMLRYHNYDIRSPYNRDAALWVAQPDEVPVPDRSTAAAGPRAAMGRVESEPAAEAGSKPPPPKPKDPPNGSSDWPPPKNGPNGASGPPRSNPEGSESMPGRVRQFMNRYGGIFANRPRADGPARASSPISEVEMVASFYREALAPIASDSGRAISQWTTRSFSSSRQSNGSSNGSFNRATPGDSARRADNGITFIE